MREKLGMEPPEDITPQKLAIVEQKRRYELITPLYGGGVVANHADPVTVVRATEIRAQLRFWWRACRGWQSDGDLKKLKELEDAIWGKAYEKEKEVKEEALSPAQADDPLRKWAVQIIVEPISFGHDIEVFQVKYDHKSGRNISEYNRDSNVPAYIAFPLQHSRQELAEEKPVEKKVRNQVKFLLVISYPSAMNKEIEAALWAWETFGGLGARTRRGFGALNLLAIIEDDSWQNSFTIFNVKQKIQEKLDTYIEPGNFPAGIPHLSKEMQFVVIPSSKDPMRAWNDLINRFRNFRQQKDAVTKRSLWPEAEAIRRIAGKKAKSTFPSPHKFPRAVFGLPIIFHFTGGDAPTDHTLNEVDKQGKSKQRFASPLILRPLLCHDNQVVGLALLLEGSRVDLQHLVLQDEKKTLSPVEGTLTPGEARSLTRNLPVIGGETDVLQAFMKYLKGAQ